MPKKRGTWTKAQRTQYFQTIKRKRLERKETKEPEIVVVHNISGEKVDINEWTKGDKSLALNVAHFLNKQGATVAISTTDDGCILLDYAYAGRIQPTLKVASGGVNWPKGTDFNLMMKFLGG